jgi:dTDP-4-amino-4,6-dideoxygalactose transaminase
MADNRHGGLELEKEFAAFIGVQNALAVNSASSASTWPWKPSR